MSVLDLPKLAMKARKIQSQMKQTKAAGKHKSVALVIDGTYKIVGRELDREELAKKFPDVDLKLVEKIANGILDDAEKALEDAKGALQQEMSSGMDMDDLKKMLD